jgi:hypothetical protein
MEQQHRAAAAAQRAVELSVVRFRNGVDSYVNVITAQNAFLTAREAELQVQLRQLTAGVNLINNLGAAGRIRSCGVPKEWRSARPPTARTARFPRTMRDRESRIRLRCPTGTSSPRISSSKIRTPCLRILRQAVKNRSRDGGAASGASL